jgi:hypothetical protein
VRDKPKYKSFQQPTLNRIIEAAEKEKAATGKQPTVVLVGPDDYCQIRRESYIVVGGWSDSPKFDDYRIDDLTVNGMHFQLKGLLKKGEYLFLFEEAHGG